MTSEHHMHFKFDMVIENGKVKIAADVGQRDSNESSSARSDNSLDTQLALPEAEDSQIRRIREVYEKLREFDRISLSKCQLIPGYVRHETTNQSSFGSKIAKLVSALKLFKGREYYLLCGKPGTGKTYLVECLARHNDHSRRYMDIDLAKANEEEFDEALRQMANENNPLFCFVDELTAKLSQDWPFPLLLPYLEGSLPTDSVLVLASSTRTDVQELLARIESGHRGPDLVSRIPYGNIIEVPVLTLQDRLTIFIHRISVLSSRDNREFSDVSKQVLIYVACTPIMKDARQIGFLADAVFERLGRQDRRVLLKHLFDTTDPEMGKFLELVQAAGISGDSETTKVLA